MSGTIQPHSRGVRTTYLLLILAAVQWAANIVMGRLAVGEIAPMLLVSLRWFIVCAMMALFYRRTIAAAWPALRRQFGLMLLLGISGFTGFTALFYAAAHSTTGANMAIIQGATPLFVFTLAFIAHGKRFGLFQGIGMMLALFGVVVVAIRGDLAVLQSLSFNSGDMMMIGATFCYSVYTVWLAKKPAAHPMGLFAVLAAIALVTSLPLTAIEAMQAPLHWPTATGWLLAFLIAIFPSFLAQLFFILGVEAIGPGRAGIFVNLIPVFGAVLSVLFLGESFGWYQAAGLSLVMLGIVCAQKR